MAPSAFRLVPGFPDAMLIGKGGGANDGNGHFRCRKATWSLIEPPAVASAEARAARMIS